MTINQKYLTHDQQRDLVIQYQQIGDLAARNRLVAGMLDFVHLEVKRIGYNKTTDASDLVQQGALGLIHACDLFDPTMNLKFSTYAWWWVRQFIFRYLASNDLIKLPTNHKHTILRIRKAQTHLRGKLGRRPSPEEIAASAKSLDLKTTRTVLNRPESNWRYLSTDAPISSNRGNPRVLGDTISDPAPSPEEIAEQKAECHRVTEAVDSLKWTQREKIIIKHRILENDDDKLSLRELGDMAGVSRERIRQVQKSIVERIKEKLIADVQPERMSQ